MKRCTKCGIEKDETEFHKNRTTKDGLHWWCKECKKEQDKEYREQHKGQKKKYREKHKEQISQHDKKMFACAKKFCQNIPQEKIVKLECRVCGKEFGRTASGYNKEMRRQDQYHPKYCSKVCQNIGMSKKWQQTQSPYAKKIKELQKEYK